MVGLRDLIDLFQPKQVYKVKASAAWTGSGIATCYYFALFVYTKTTTQPQGRKPPPIFQPQLAPGQLKLVCLCDCIVFWLTSFSGCEILSLLHLSQYRFRHLLYPLSFLRLNEFWLFYSNTSSSATLPAPQSRSWRELEIGSRQDFSTALVTIFIFIGHYWKYLPGCMQNQVVAFSQPCYTAGL